MLRKFIERPVLSTVISITILILGGISFFTLPITLFPDIAPPSVQVTATYPGANAEVVARSVATPLEEGINGVEDMTYMTSNSNNDGTMTLTVYFRQGTDPDIASVNVQNRVSKAESQIPQEVLQQGIATQKIQNSMLMFVAAYSEDATVYDDLFMENYLKINVIPQIQRIPGVAQTQVLGAKDYSMRIWLKPERLAVNNLTPQDVLLAIKDQNIDAAPGRLGQSGKEEFEYVMKYKGKLDKKEDYENIVIKAKSDGSKLVLKDVARVEFGSITYTAKNKYDGKPAAGFYVMQTAKSNANEILTSVEKELEELNKVLPEGMKVTTMYNSKSFLDASMFQVKETLIIAFLLVFLVVYLFLQDIRATLIPAIAVPVAIVGTFFFLQLFGFTINLLTMFALVLAIGIVVDDAIVVVEAVHAKMEHKDMSARKATIESMSEISGAIISITLVMSAVFVPVAFMQGPSGVFFRQFALTLAMAILISAVNALTLSPALCVLFLKAPHKPGEKIDRTPKRDFLSRFFNAFNIAFNTLTNRYMNAIRFLIRKKWVAISLLLLVTISSVIMIKRTPAGFIPTEDQDFVVYSLNTPPGSSSHRTERASLQIDSIINSMPGKNHLFGTTGFNFITNATSSPYAVGFIHLKPPAEREGMGNPDQIAAYLTEKTASVKDANAFFFNFPTVQGFGNVSGFEFMLQDRTNSSLETIGKTAQAFTEELMKRKEIGYAFTTFAANNPQYSIEVDNFKAKQLGVSVTDLMQTIQIYYGSGFVSDFNRFGKYYRVMAQADIEYRKNEASLDGIMVKNNLGEMVPVKTLVALKRVYGPETVTRNNLFTSAGINGVPAVGYSTGDAIKAIEEVAATSLPRGYSYEWTGMTREEKASEGQSAIIFLLSIIFVYILLAAQYESYILPLAVILSVPTGIFGVFLFVGLAGLENNIYVQVGLIMLIGLLAKNAILIVEFAVQRRVKGMSLVSSALQAARLRLRPILMTSFAFIVGMLPLIFVKGAAAIGNHSIGYSTVGGMLAGVLLGIFIVPILYIIFQHLQEKISSKRQLEDETIFQKV